MFLFLYQRVSTRGCSPLYLVCSGMPEGFDSSIRLFVFVRFNPRYMALHTGCDNISTITGGFLPAIHAAASMMEAGKGGEAEGAKAAQ